MKRYPIGIQSFEKLITDELIYVDKTEFIYKLISSPSGYFFLSRPRRFGKSLFLSTLKAFFEGKRELFKGLYIDSCPDVEWDSHPVIYFDLNAEKYTADTSLLINRLSSQLKEYEKEYQVVSESNSLAGRFLAILKGAYEKTGKKVVILVDEYEKPILDTLHLDEAADTHRDILGGFYSVIKSSDPYIHFCFLTGITRFAHLNIFSGLNNLNDISLDTRYESICGLTTQEIIDYFPEGLENLAKKERVDKEKVIDILKFNYDGYHFSENLVDIYNPFSLLNALDKSNIGYYWYATGTPTFLIKMLKHSDMELTDLDDVEVDSRAYTGGQLALKDPIDVMFQAGYLTIKAYDEESRLFRLGYPNFEVKSAFVQSLSTAYTGLSSSKSTVEIRKFLTDLNNGEIDSYLERMNAFFADFPYENALEVEKHFQNVMYIILKLLGVYANIEYHTSSGRIDLLVKTPRFIYIFEFKRDQAPEKALEQIERKGYALPFKADGRKIFKVGVEFSTAERRISNWKYVED